MKQSIQMNLFNYFLDDEQFTLKEANSVLNDIKQMNIPEPSIRARIYEGVNKGIFKRLSRGVYSVVKVDSMGLTNTCILINGDGRDLSMLQDNSVDTILTDHPYLLLNSHKGGNRNLANYSCFRYTFDDFKEKYRVLKPGGFLVEFLPERNSDNIQYLNEIIKMALSNNMFEFYSVVPWKKGTFTINQGRKSKNTEDIYFFTKGKARNLKLDNKKNLALAKKNHLSIPNGSNSNDVANILRQNNISPCYMSGTNGMLPTEFDVQPTPKNKKVHPAEKPIQLLEMIIDYISLPNETILDQFAGSGNLGIAALNTNRDSIVIEYDYDTFMKMKDNIEEKTKTI